MKEGKFPTSSYPIVRILLVAPHLYQVSLRNIYGYLKTVLLDRCKKVGAQYRHFEKSYFIESSKLLELKKQFEDVLQMPNQDTQMKFKIQDFSMTNIKMITRHDRKSDSKENSKHRIILMDRFSQNRYFYAKKRIEQMFASYEKERPSKEQKNLLILTSQINKKIWTSVVLKKPKTESKQQLITKTESYQLIELTFSELTSKKPLQPQVSKTPNSIVSNEPNKIYIITYDNLKFLEGSWFLREIKNIKTFFTDDAEFLISSQSEISTLQNKKRNFESYKLLLQNYSIQNELFVFLSKLPEPCDLFKLLILVRPKNFSGIEFATSFNNYFNDHKLTSEERRMYEEFTSWFRKRYRVENKCFKEFYYLLNNVVLKQLDENVFKKTPNLLPSLELSPLLSENYQITLIESSPELIEKFKTMDKKYKKLCPSINLKQILQAIHDKQKSEQNKFQITTKFDDLLISKHSKNFFFQAKEVMLSSKIQAILRRIFFVVNAQKERIAIVVEDQKLEKRLKKYLKETQIEFAEYTLTKQKHETDMLSFHKANTSSQIFAQFDSNPLVQVCIINISVLYRFHTALIKQKKKKTENNYEEDLYSQNNNAEIFVPKITTVGSIHFIDSFWYEFCFEKELLLNEIFNFQLSYIEQIKAQGKSVFQQVFKRLQPPSNYYLFEGSHEKMMLQKYLQRKQELQSFKVQPLQSKGTLLSSFINQMISAEKTKFENLNCQVIDYLDIDEEYDKIEEEAKRIKNAKGLQAFEEKVFLPKFTKPEHKSFKEMMEQKLSQKNIDQILEDSDQIFKDTSETTVEPPLTKEKQPQPVNKVSDKLSEVISNYLNQVSKDKQEINTNPIQDSLFDCLLPEIHPETVKLESNYFGESQNLNSNIFENHEQQQPEKDLFDQLLAPNIQPQYFSKYFNTKESEPEDVETESEYDEEKNLKRLRKTSSTKAKIESKFDESLLFQNFGYMAYHQKQWAPQQQQSWSKVKTEMDPKPLLNPQKEEKSIEIIMPDEVIDVQKMNSIKAKKQSRFGRSRQLKQIIQQKAGSIPFYEGPKEKRLSNKKLYEEAISKSKQLWQKKLRKEKETIILAPKKLELSLVPKPDWKESLTESEVKQLKEKGINQ